MHLYTLKKIMPFLENFMKMLALKTMGVMCHGSETFPLMIVGENVRTINQKLASVVPNWLSFRILWIYIYICKKYLNNKFKLNYEKTEVL